MDAKEQVKQRLHLEEVVGESVALKKAGTNRLKGLCPFHNEKTPSFHVFTDKQYFRCFGCDAYGDVFEFVQKTQNLEFHPALELLAARVGIDLSSDSDTRIQTQPRVAKKTKPEPHTEPMLPADWIDDLVTAAHNALKRQETDAAQNAAAYFEQRGLAHLIDELRLGVVDETVKLEQAQRYGQLRGKLRSLRGRATIPTLKGGVAVWFKARDISGRTVAELKAAEVAKYDGPSGSVPAPFNPVGLDHAVKSGKSLLMVEGEVDGASVLAAFDGDFPVVGLPGGNLPKGYADQIAQSGITHVYLLMHPDKAGSEHTERANSALSALGVRVYVVTPPDTDDLNELLVKGGPEKLHQTLVSLLESTSLSGISDLLYVRETWLSELDARAQRPHAAYTTGLAELDTLLGGGYSEGLHLVGGITGGGKTSFALHVALTNALAGRPVIYASYEQSRLELWARIASRVTGVPYLAIKRGTYDERGEKLLTSSVLKSKEGWAQLEAASKNLKIVEGGDALSRQTSAYTVETLAATARDIKVQHGAPPLIVVDYLQRTPAPAEMRIKDIRERVGYIAGLLQVYLARDVGCPVLALSSIGRDSYSLQEASLEKRLGAFKEAGELEYTAYTSLLLYGLSDELQDSLNLRPSRTSTFKPMTLDLVKNREGEIGQLGVQWQVARGAWDGATQVRGYSR